MTLSEELLWRGFVNQTTLGDLKSLDSETRTFYIGFDASADSQTVGNLAGLMFAKVFLRQGYKGIILAGGSTSLIGDPGGKDKERLLQSEETIQQNVANAVSQFKKIMSGQTFTLVNNLDWTKDLRVLTFLRDIGKHFSMTPLIQREYISERLGSQGAGISYAEFSYTILQGYDYLHLFDEFGCTLQLGGSDQWGNCLSGVELIRRTRGKEVDVITLNLVIDKTTGKKFGKSEEGAVWLDGAKTPPYRFYQFWLNTDDNGVEDFLKIYTELDKAAVEQLMRDQSQKPESRVAQKALAYEVTKIVHGEEQAEQVRKVSETLFGGQNLSELKPNEWKILGEELNILKVKTGEPLADMLVVSGLAASKTEARRFLSDSAVYINNLQFSSDKQTIEDDDFINGHAMLRRGKNQQVVLQKT